ncbi:MAG: hypothetical protein EP297_13340 [Gammaproteobacteria bacterium]|nr:MAG: hypothetical protein EP297_13340 [Gammaproteobacteria bacterium]
MKKPLISRRPIILLSASVLLATLFLITLVLLPHGISYGIKQWILDNGGERVSIENVDFNPFTGNFAIYNLNVGKNNITPLNITEIKLHLNWLSLWSNQVLIEGVSIRGVNLLIDQSEKAYSQIGGIMLAPEPKTKTADESDSPWGLAIQFLNMRDVSIDYKIQALSSRLQIKRFEMKSLASAHPNQETIVKLDGQVDNAEIKLQGKLKPFSAEPGFTGKVEMKGVTLNKYASLLPPSISQVKGSSNIDTEFGIHLTCQADRSRLRKKALSH